MGFSSRMETGRSFALERRTSDVGVKRKTRRKDVFSVLIIVRRAMGCGRMGEPVRSSNAGRRKRANANANAKRETRRDVFRFVGGVASSLSI